MINHQEKFIDLHISAVFASWSNFEDACNFSMYTLLFTHSTPLIILQAQKNLFYNPETQSKRNHKQITLFQGSLQNYFFGNLNEQKLHFVFLFQVPCDTYFGMGRKYSMILSFLVLSLASG